MFPVSEDKCFSKKKTDFGVIVAIKQQRRLSRIRGRSDLVASGWVRLWRYDADDTEDADDGGCGERQRRTS